MATLTKEQKALVTKRDELIKQFEEQDALAQAAAATGDKAAAASANAKKANRSREIGEIQVDMALEGIDFEEWNKPKTKRSSSKRPPVSEEQLKADLEKIGRVFNTDKRATVKESADNRITSLLKTAERHGYSVEDPRQAAAA